MSSFVTGYISQAFKRKASWFFYIKHDNDATSKAILTSQTFDTHIKNMFTIDDDVFIYRDILPFFLKNTYIEAFVRENNNTFFINKFFVHPPKANADQAQEWVEDLSEWVINPETIKLVFSQNQKEESQDKGEGEGLKRKDFLQIVSTSKKLFKLSRP